MADTLEDKVDKLLILVLEVVKSQTQIIESQEDIIECLHNINLSGDGFSYAQER